MEVLMIKQEFKFVVQNCKFILSTLSFSTLVEKSEKLIKPISFGWSPFNFYSKIQPVYYENSSSPSIAIDKKMQIFFTGPLAMINRYRLLLN